MRERGQWTVLLADTRASEAARGVARCIDLLAETARKRGGRIVRGLADRVVALFPRPALAAEAAAAMQRAAMTLSTSRNAALGVRIAFHAAVPAARGDVVNDTLQHAARLLAQARSEHIITSLHTAAALGDLYRARMRVVLPRRPSMGNPAQHCNFLWRDEAETRRACMRRSRYARQRRRSG
jgi:class 3 adenylate cyclase